MCFEIVILCYDYEIYDSLFLPNKVFLAKLTSIFDLVNIILNFILQVRIPHSIRAVNWFCSQVNFTGVFPQFFISLRNNEEVREMASLDGIIGVSGVGAAIYLQGYSYTSKEKNLIRLNECPLCFCNV